MNIDDLAKLLTRGANITVNIQGGEHNTMYTAPVQDNRRYGGNQAASPRCEICGHSGGDLWRDSFWKSYYHPSCREDQFQQAQLERPDRKSRIARSHEQVSASGIPMLPEQTTPQIADPVEAEEIDPQEQWDRDMCLYLTTGSTG